MDTDSLKNTVIRWLPAAVIGVLLAISLSLLHTATQDMAFSEAYGKTLLYLNAFILLVLGIAILTNLVRAIYQWHTRQAGSRFTIRLLSGFLVLSLLPVVVVAYFSMNFIGKNVGKQLDVRISGALNDSLELAQIALATRSQAHLQDLARLAESLPGKDRLEVAALLDQWRLAHDAHEAILLSEDQRFIATSVDEVDKLIPFFPVRDLMRTMANRSEYSHVEPTNDNSVLFIRVAMRVRYGRDEQAGILTAMLPVSERERSLAASVAAAQQEYTHISFNQENLKDTFRLALLVIVVLTVLFSLWAAFIFSRRLTQPVRDLVEGTLAVASGDLEKKLPVSDRDDFSLLARSFNTMTKRLSGVQVEREQARRLLQQEHDYLYVVLEHLSSGVVTLDEDMVIRRVNTAASQILGYPLQDQLGLSLTAAFGGEEGLPLFLQALRPWLDNPQEDWQAEFSLTGEGVRKVLVCRGAGLPYESMQQQGYVLVFEDVTEVVQAEHDAAWGEVARRLAHEIKNPLTPIQLSAERLSRKLGKVLDAESEDFLNRMTRTIIQQVDTLKAMVNAFSEYAKAPVLMPQAVNLNQLVREVAELYVDNPQAVQLELDQQDIPSLALDVHRIRQLLVNLIKNALEAIGEGREDGRILVRTRFDTRYGGQVVLCVQDNGPGIPQELLPNLFEPYVTSKHKGTGLGLAIVKKIVEEHDGNVSAKNAEPNGAIITIGFPVNG